MLEHGFGCFARGLHGLHAEVAEHRVGLPASKELNLVFIPVGAEQGGGAPGSEALAADAVWEYPSNVVDRGGGFAEACSDVECSDVVGLTVLVVVCVEWSVRGCVLVSQVLNSSGHPLSGTPEGVFTWAVADCFVSYTVLLVGKDESNEGAPSHVMQRADCGIEVVPGRSAEEHVFEPKRCAFSGLGGGRACIFTGSAEEVEGQGGKVDDSFSKGSVGMVLEDFDESFENGEAARCDAGRCRVVVLEELEDAFESGPILLGLREAGIWETQLDELRSNSA